MSLNLVIVIVFFPPVLSAELLQAQTEVGVLLQRAGQAARDKTESVSSKVHTQLLQLADEKAAAAEQRTLNLEREVSTIHLLCL